MQVCRVVNGYGVDNFKACNDGRKFGAIRSWNAVCNKKQNDCEFYYVIVYHELWKLQQKHFLRTCKMRFWDKGKALPTDTFRFWYEKRADFESKILQQTLIPYVSG